MRRTLMIITVALVLCLCGCSEVLQISDIRRNQQIFCWFLS